MTPPAERQLSDQSARYIILLASTDEVGKLDPKVALNCGLVSRQWSDIVDQMRLLLRFSVFMTKPGYDQVIKEWLKEGVLNLPLKTSTPSETSEILEAIKPFSSQLQELDLDVPHYYLAKLLSDPKAPLTSLQTLKLYLSGKSVLTLDSSATNLRQVSLVLMGGDPSNLRMPWNRLQYLALEVHNTTTLECFRAALSKCTRLDTLTIQALSGVSLPEKPLKPLRSNLRRLSLIISASTDTIAYFLNFLTLPFLEELKIGWSTETGEWANKEIIALCERSLARLMKVSIYGNGIREKDLADFVKQIPTLQQLSATDGCRNYVTPTVTGLLPQTEGEIFQRNMAYVNKLNHDSQRVYDWTTGADY